MTIPATASEIAYASDGITATFTIPFHFDTSADLKVTKTDSLGNVTEITTGFSVAGGGGDVGSLTFSPVLASGYTITISDDPDFTQPHDYTPNDPFPAESHETALDRCVRLSKRLSQEVKRALRFSDGDPVTDATLGSVDTRKGKYLFFNAVTGAIEYAVALATTALSQSLIGLLLIPQTPAEASALVTPTYYYYKAGDLRRYGATAGGDVTSALTQAAAQANQVGGAPIYIDAALGTSCTVTAGVSFTRPVAIYGSGLFLSGLKTSSNITIFSFDVNASKSIVYDLYLEGKNAGATTAAILYTNSNYNQIHRVFINKFGYGVYYAKGINSCYDCSISDSFIQQNLITNIKGEGATNALIVHNTVFGASPIGLSLIDSTNLTITGGDVEGCTTTAVDLDASTTLFAGHTIVGLHMEGNNTSGGDIRIGNTAMVIGVRMEGVLFGPNGSNGAINAVRCTGLYVRGTMATSTAFLKKTTLLLEDIDVGNTTNNVPRYRASSYKAHSGDESVVTQRSEAFVDGNFDDGMNFNQFQIQPTSVGASKSYYAGIDLIELANVAGSTGANAKLYARLLYALNSKGDTTKVGAAKIVGDVDASGGAWSYGVSATAPATATSGTIATKALRNSRVAPAGNITAVILEAGSIDGQVVTVYNQSAFTITFDVAGTSNVADGATSAIPANCSRSFSWAAGTARWYRAA